MLPVYLNPHTISMTIITLVSGGSFVVFEAQHERRHISVT